MKVTMWNTPRTHSHSGKRGKVQFVDKDDTTTMYRCPKCDGVYHTRQAFNAT